MELLERGSLPERYEIAGPAGRGGMGVVFRGRDVKLGRPVALKFLSAGGPVDLAIALREARALAQLSHDGVLRVFDVIEGPEGVWIVTEWLEGRSLDTLPRKGTLPEILSLAQRLLETLSAVHAAGIVHRDLKPSNVMICSSGRAVLIDFGVAYCEGANSGYTLAGTPRYSAPWCFEGEAPSEVSDLFSLGMVLLEMISGTIVVPELAPLPLYRYLRKHLSSRVDELLDGQFPPWEPVIRALLAREARPPQASEVASLLREVSTEDATVHLRRWVAGEPAPLESLVTTLKRMAEKASVGCPPRERACWLSYLAALQNPVPVESPSRHSVAAAPTGLSTRQILERRGRLVWMGIVATSAILIAVVAMGIRFVWWGGSSPAETKGKEALVPTAPTALASSPTTLPMPSPTPGESPIPALAAEATPRAPRPRPTPRPMPPLAVATAVARARPCAVQFSANVWARLHVDGAFVMQLPSVRPVALSPGRHVVRLENPMTEPLTAEIRVPSAESERFHFVLQPLPTPTR